MTVCILFSPVKLLASLVFIPHLSCEMRVLSPRVGGRLSKHAQQFQMSPVLWAGADLPDTFGRKNSQG